MHRLHVYRLYQEQTFEQALVQQLYNAQNSNNVEDLVCEGVNFESNHLGILSSHISKTMPPIEVSQFTDTTSARIALEK